MFDLKDLNLTGLDFQYVLGLTGIFVGIFLLGAAVNYFIVQPLQWRRQINQRLRGNKREEEVRVKIFKALQEVHKSPLLKLVEQLTGWSRVQNLERQLLQADIYLSPNIFITVLVSMAVGGYIAGSMFFADIFWSLGLGLGMGLLPMLFLRWKKLRKTAKFEKYMPDAMELLARSLRAGHTLQATLELVSQEIPAPLGSEMRITYEEQRLGLSVNQAFRRMAERVASRDLHYFVTAVLIQTETGGNLAEILENIGNIIRERLKLKGKVRGLTAEGRFSAVILALLPLATFAALFVINQDYAMVLIREPMGNHMLYAGILSVIFGALVMKRMVTIKV